MTYGAFKTFLKSIMRGDKNLPQKDNTVDDEVLKPLVIQSLKDVARETTPLVLLTTNMSEEFVKQLKNGLYIRKPKTPTDDNTELEMDEDLVYAVAYFTAYKLGSESKKKGYKNDGIDAIDKFEWNLDESLRDGKFSSIEEYALDVIDRYGFKKIYSSRLIRNDGVEFVWDDFFISKLERYLIGISQEMSKSDLTNIEKFLSFMDGEMTDSEELEAFSKFNEYLATLEG